jgi:molybdate transport system ATP-binding protein
MLSVQIKKQFRASGSSGFNLQINEEFPPGFTVLFGPSGAGKSTILDCIAGLQLPDAGRIDLGGELFFDGAQKIAVAPQRRRIAYVFQSLALFPHLSVERNVGYGLSLLNEEERRLRVEHALQSFHIVEMRRRKPRALSGGEQQRVALARSLSTDPRVLLLDEPLTGLDARLRETILQDLREWNASRQIPILYVTHNREEVNAIGERVIALAQGRVVGRGAPTEVLDTPHSLAIAHAAGFENVLTTTVAELRPADGVMDVVLLPSNRHLEVPLGTGQQAGNQVRVAIRAGDILVATEMPRSISARNILSGMVESMEVRGALVVLQVDAGARLVVHVTPAAVRALSLESGTVVWLVVKTHSCRVVSD